MLKRLFNFLFACTFLLISLPVIFFVVVLIKLDSRGPVLFKQERVGLNGKAFQMYKFRSMVPDAEQQGPYFTSTDDPRITRMGRFLRKTSLDELPQLLNVLLGDMSMVGPRPNVFAQQELYTEDDWIKRNSVRPGITGLAQAKVRSAATAEQRTLLDLEYVDRSSVVFDIWVIVLTVKQVLISRDSN